MSENTLFCKRFHAIKRERAGGVGSASPTLTITDLAVGDQAMAVDSQYTDSESVFKQNNQDSWQSLGFLAVKAVNAAYAERMAKKVFTHIYVIACDGHSFLKIGRSSDISARLESLTCGSPWPLHVLYSARVPRPLGQKIESACHEQLAEFRASGEWFSCAPNDAIRVVDFNVQNHSDCEVGK